MAPPSSKKLLIFRLASRHLEAALGLLYQNGIFTLQEKGHGTWIELVAQIPPGSSADPLKKKLLRQAEQLFPEGLFSSVKVALPPSDDWKQNFLKYLHPFSLPQPKVLPTPPLKIDPRPDPNHEKSADTIFLAAGLAFGTGTHPTTQSAAWLLQEYLYSVKNKAVSVLDVGCGTGILALVAKKRGAAWVEAIENDPEARQVARETMDHNEAQTIPIHAELKRVRKKFDCVVANIIPKTLIELQSLLKARVRPGGVLILGGILYKERQEILKTFLPMKCIKQKNQKGWTTLLLTI